MSSSEINNEPAVEERKASVPGIEAYGPWEKRESQQLIRTRSGRIFFGPYLILESMGQGSFGEVRRAVDTSQPDAKPVAMKVVPHSKLVTDKDKQHLELEIACMRRVQGHQNIVRFLEAMEGVDATVLIEELIEGPELLEHILRQPQQRLPENLAADYFAQLLDAVRHCHNNFVIHRDIKAENIMIETATNRVKLMDFGLSTFLTPGVFKDTFCGSPNYLSPEILYHHAYIGPEIDVWALGVVLFTMVTGLFPWPGENTLQMLRNAAKANYKMPDHVSPHCRDLITQMLKPDPRDRITISAAMQHPFVKPYFNNNGFAISSISPDTHSSVINVIRRTETNLLAVPQGDVLPSVAKLSKSSIRVSALDQAALELLERFGFDKEDTKQALADDSRKVSWVYELYTLVQKYNKEVREGSANPAPAVAPAVDASADASSSASSSSGNKPVPIASAKPSILSGLSGSKANLLLSQKLGNKMSSSADTLPATSQVAN